MGGRQTERRRGSRPPRPRGSEQSRYSSCRHGSNSRKSSPLIPPDRATDAQLCRCRAESTGQQLL